MLRCKKGKRSDIKPDEWDKFGYFAKATREECALRAQQEEVLQREIVYDQQTVPIPRVKAKLKDKMRRAGQAREISPEQFFKDVASKAQPVIVEES